MLLDFFRLDFNCPCIINVIQLHVDNVFFGDIRIIVRLIYQFINSDEDIPVSILMYACSSFSDCVRSLFQRLEPDLAALDILSLP